MNAFISLGSNKVREYNSTVVGGIHEFIYDNMAELNVSDVYYLSLFETKCSLFIAIWTRSNSSFRLCSYSMQAGLAKLVDCRTIWLQSAVCYHLGSNWSPLVVPNCETLKENVFYSRLMHKKFITLRKMPAKTVLKALSSGRPLSKTTGTTWFLNLIGIIQIDGSPLTALRSLLLRIFIFTGDRGSD